MNTSNPLTQPVLESTFWFPAGPDRTRVWSRYGKDSSSASLSIGDLEKSLEVWRSLERGERVCLGSTFGWPVGVEKGLGKVHRYHLMGVEDILLVWYRVLDFPEETSSLFDHLAYYSRTLGTPFPCGPSQFLRTTGHTYHHDRNHHRAHLAVGTKSLLESIGELRVSLGYGEGEEMDEEEEMGHGLDGDVPCATPRLAVFLTEVLKVDVQVEPEVEVEVVSGRLEEEDAEEEVEGSAGEEEEGSRQRLERSESVWTIASSTSSLSSVDYSDASCGDSVFLPS